MNRMPNALIEDLVGDLDPVNPIRLSHGIALVALAALVTVLLVEAVEGLWHGIVGGSASPMFFLANGMLGLLGTASALAVIRMATPHVGNDREGARWSAGMLALLPLTALLMLGGSAFFAALTQDLHGFGCFLAGSAAGLVVGGTLILWLRRGAPVSSVAAGTYTGVAAGAFGSFAYGLSCPIDTIGHLGIWHVAPVALSAAVGRFAIPPLVRW